MPEIKRPAPSPPPGMRRVPCRGGHKMTHLEAPNTTIYEFLDDKLIVELIPANVVESAKRGEAAKIKRGILTWMDALRTPPHGLRFDLVLYFSDDGYRTAENVGWMLQRLEMANAPRTHGDEVCMSYYLDWIVWGLDVNSSCGMGNAMLQEFIDQRSGVAVDTVDSFFGSGGALRS